MPKKKAFGMLSQPNRKLETICALCFVKCGSVCTLSRAQEQMTAAARLKAASIH
jgi:hypothetical protein